MNYPTPPSMQMYAQCFQYLQMFLFLVVFAGEGVFVSMSLPVPPPVQAMSDNKMASFMFIWLIGNMVASTFLNSGAFEIHFQDKTIWSTLANNKRMPTYMDIFNGCKRAGIPLMSSSADP